MSEENVEIVRRVYEAWNRRRLEACFGPAGTPRSMWYDPEQSLDAGSLPRACDGVRRFLGRARSSTSTRSTSSVEEFVDLGDAWSSLVREIACDGSSSAD